MEPAPPTPKASVPVQEEEEKKKKEQSEEEGEDGGKEREEDEDEEGGEDEWIPPRPPGVEPVRAPLGIDVGATSDGAGTWSWMDGTAWDFVPYANDGLAGYALYQWYGKIRKSHLL